MKSKRLGALFLAACFACAPLASAEVKTYEGIGEYVMSDFETPDIAKQRAKARAEQSCVEQAGVYVKSYTRMVNAIVTEDEVEAIANNIINVIDERYMLTPVTESGGSFLVMVTIKVTVDSERVNSWLERDYAKNAELVEENKRLKDEMAKQETEIAELREKLIVANNEAEKKQLKSEVINADRKFLATQKLKQGWRFFGNYKYEDAIIALSRAIELDDKNGDAYNNRACVYSMQGEYQHAIDDFNKAIGLIDREKINVLYSNLAYLYFLQNRNEQAMIYVNKSIDCEPRYANAYAVRGVIYAYQGEYGKAMIDCNKAIDINPKYETAYELRGNVYEKQGKYKEAINDYNKAIEIDPKCASAYNSRGNWPFAV